MRSRTSAWLRHPLHALLLLIVVLAAGLVLAPAASATYAYVSNQGAGTISVYSTNSNGTLSPITCPGCAPGGSPNNIAITPNARYLYITDVTNDVVLPYQINAGGTLTKIACSGSNCATGSEPYYDTVSPNGRFLYVSNTGDNTISVYAIGSDGSLTAVTCTTCQTGSSPEEISLTPDGRFLYEPNYGSGSSASTISVFSVGTDGALTPVSCSAGCATGDGPEALMITPNGRNLYVANAAGDSISAYTIAADGTLTPVSCTTCTTGSLPTSMAIAPQGNALYAANGSSDSVSPFTIGTTGALTPIPCSGSNCTTGSFPNATAISPGGHFLYTLNASSQNLSIFAVASDGSLTPVACSGSNCSTGSGPNDLALTPDQAPTAAFVAHPAHPGSATGFDGSASSAAAGQTVARYDWSFGDGTTDANGGPTPSHAYTSPGTYQVTLVVTDNAGCSTSLVYTGALTLCNGGPSATVAHSVTIAAVIHPSKLTVSPRRAHAGMRVCYTFRFTSRGRGISGALVRFAGHHRRTSGSGKARLCLKLKRGTHTARATKHGYRSARTTVRITALRHTARSRPSFTG